MRELIFFRLNSSILSHQFSASSLNGSGNFGWRFPDPKPPFWCTNPKPVYGVSSVQQRPSRWRELLGRFDVTNATWSSHVLKKRCFVDQTNELFSWEPSFFSGSGKMFFFWTMVVNFQTSSVQLSLIWKDLSCKKTAKLITFHGASGRSLGVKKSCHAFFGRGLNGCICHQETRLVKKQESMIVAACGYFCSSSWTNLLSSPETSHKIVDSPSFQHLANPRTFSEMFGPQNPTPSNPSKSPSPSTIALSKLLTNPSSCQKFRRWHGKKRV